MITADTAIEELVETLPESVGYLLRWKIRCIAWSGPLWGSLGEIARRKGYTAVEISQMVADLNAIKEASALANKKWEFLLFYSLF